MGRFVDSVIAYRILRLLTTPFEDTDAFKLGIIDKNGKELKSMNSLTGDNERQAYTILHRMIFRIKRIIEKVPIENKKVVSYAAALSLIREYTEKKIEPVDLEFQFLNKLKTDLTEEINITKELLESRKTLTFKQYTEEAPANNAAATPGVAGLDKDTVGVRPGKRPKLLKRKEVNYA